MIVNQLAKLLYERNLDKRDLVKIIGLDNHIVKKIFDGNVTHIDFKTLNLLCYALECDTNDIFKYFPD